MEIKSIPVPTLKRLVQYHSFLQNYNSEGSRMISSTQISEHLAIDPVLVRKDLQYTSLTGKPKTGWKVEELKDALEKTLGWDNPNSAFLAGAGKLGSTLLSYDGFMNYGLKFVAAFDSNPAVIGKKINGVMVLPVEKMSDLARRMHIHIGVLTVPADSAQKVADTMIEGGIRGIWSFAPVQLKTPGDIVVVNAQLSAEIAVMINKLSNYIQHNNIKGTQV